MDESANTNAAATPPKSVNIQPIIDLLSKAGAETTEYQHAKATSRIAMIAFFCGLAGTLADAVAQAMGSTGKLGMIAGTVSMVAGLAVKLLSDSSYASNRAAVKDSAAALAANATSANDKAEATHAITTISASLQNMANASAQEAQSRSDALDRINSPIVTPPPSRS